MTWSREGDRNHIPRANPVCVCVSSAQINHPRRRHDLNAKTRRDAKSQPAGTNTDGARVRESGVFHIHAYIYIYIYLFISLYIYILVGALLVNRHRHFEAWGTTNTSGLFGEPTFEQLKCQWASHR